MKRITLELSQENINAFVILLIGLMATIISILFIRLNGLEVPGVFMIGASIGILSQGINVKKKKKICS